MRRSNVFLLYSTFILLSFQHFSLSAIDAPVSTIATVYGCQNASVSVPVTVVNFTNISSLTLRIEYDTLVMRYSEASLNSQLTSCYPGLISNTQVSGSTYKIMIIWNCFSATKTLASGATLVTLGFYYKGGTGTLSFNNVSNNGGDCAYSCCLPIPVLLNDTPTSSFYINGGVVPGENGGSVSGGSTINYGQSTGTLTLSGHLGNVLKWQKKYMDGSYTDIPGTNGQTTYSETPPCTGTYYYRAAVQYGSCAIQYSSPATVVVVMSPGTPKTWAGTVSDNFSNPDNWSPCGVPVSVENVLVPASAPNMPVVKSNGLSCNNVTVESGATMSIDPGIQLTVNGVFTLEP